MKKSDSTKLSRYAKRIKSINYLGSCCKKCGESNIFKLSFHHREPSKKVFPIANNIGKRWCDLVIELDKCDLLCHNCHSFLHYEENIIKYDQRRKNKMVYLEYSGSECIECGYNKCPASLIFHHRNPDEKKFVIGSIGKKSNSIEKIDNIIKYELDKCDLLCANCHTVKHSDVEFYENNKELILFKSINDKEKTQKIDREDIIHMYNNGYSQSDMKKHFKSSKSTISEIIKELKSNKLIN